MLHISSLEHLTKGLFSLWISTWLDVSHTSLGDVSATSPMPSVTSRGGRPAWNDFTSSSILQSGGNKDDFLFSLEGHIVVFKVSTRCVACVLPVIAQVSVMKGNRNPIRNLPHSMPLGIASARLSVSQSAPAVLQPRDKKKKENKAFHRPPVKEQHLQFVGTEDVIIIPYS